jgi:hypothetical protein
MKVACWYPDRHVVLGKYLPPPRRDSCELITTALAVFPDSIFLDAMPIDEMDLRCFWEQLRLFLENVFKFAGMGAWLTYFACYAI